ncbi:MAG: glycosyl hydrolase [Haliscomenobacter sp.]|uniref:VPS10 domain-containing protein n=1 Tax=Haliscomenobacter sp. TaxID=2717303 RepID=UPI0029B1B510|nr:glycosyl hydrolase [Haliscomenobacter sp.]MDX2071068.1 glycosyl hydrolase [Haliscomenobacter sp.]
MKKLLWVIFGLVLSNSLQAQNPNAYSNPYEAKYFEKFKWRNIGPLRGGRSLGCAGSPGRPNEYYFGATGGGLWKTTDGGQEWLPVTDGKISCSSIGAVAVAETNPDVVYIGGGETQLRGSITQGDGVYKSSDGGKNWRHLGLKETQAISRIRVHPTNPDIVYVGALGHPYGDNEERGLFRSMDGGNTWKKILYVSPKAGVADLIIDRKNPKIIYATTWQVYRKTWKMWGGGPDCKLWKSVDGGDTWIDLSRNPGMPTGTLGKIGITVSPVDNNRLWAIVEANDGGVYRSDDAGWSWKKVNDERKLRQRAFYYSRIYADPFDKDGVYCLNVDFYKSTDGGVKFDKEISTQHGDHHDLWIDPNNPQRMILSDDGGAVVSVNGGESWTEQDYCTTQFYHVTTTNDVPYHVAGAQQDNSTLAMPSDGWDFMQAGGPNHGWYYAVGGGESGYIAPHPTNKDLFYAGSQGALLTRYDRSNGQIRDIQVYPLFFSGEPASALPERWQWTYPIVFSPKDPNVLYTCSQHVWRTKDDGQSWEKISPDLTYADPETLGPTGGEITKDMNGPEIYATVFALAPSNHDINTIWAGSDDGKIHITRDGGKSWQDITPKDLPKNSVVGIIDESKHQPGTAYVAAFRYQVDDRQPYVFRTRDFGKTWTKIVTGIADGHFSRAVREDHVRPGLLFLGTEHGVYVSFDAGDHWQPLQLNLPDTPIRDLVIKDNDVVLGTHGRGFWILDDIHPFRQLTPENRKQAAILFKPADAIRGITTAVFQYYLQEKVDSVKIEVLDAQGKLIQAFKGDNAPAQRGSGGPGAGPKPGAEAGLNTFSWNLRYPGATVFDGMIMWGARPQNGPKAPLGQYQVKFTAGAYSQTYPFQILMNPNLKGITAADLQEQFEVAMKIREKESANNEAVIRIRNLRKQMEARMKETTDASFTTAAKDLNAKLTVIEEDLYQTKNQSGQDPLNFPIKLGNRISAVRRSLESGDAKPTAGVHKVFAELSKELDGHLSKLETTISGALPGLNKQLTALQLKEIKDKVEK